MQAWTRLILVPVHLRRHRRTLNLVKDLQSHMTREGHFHRPHYHLINHRLNKIRTEIPRQVGVPRLAPKKPSGPVATEETSAVYFKYCTTN